MRETGTICPLAFFLFLYHVSMMFASKMDVFPLKRSGFGVQKEAILRVEKGK